MHYAEIRPSAVLARYVKCFWILRAGVSKEPAPEPVMPDGCIELIFNLADHFRRYHEGGTIETQPRGLVAGQMKTSAVIEPSGAIDLFGVRFHPAGASPFFNFPLNELTNSILEIGTVWNEKGSEITERIAEAGGDRERAMVMETALLSMLRGQWEADGVVNAAANIIARNGGAISVERLAAMLGVNERHLGRRFQSELGLSPKRFARIVRFQSFLGAVNSGGGVLDSALAHGYYDQAHLIREFREFSGKTPAAFFGNEHELSGAFIST